MAAVLTAFLRQAAAQPFVWSQWDCCMTPANWIRELTGVDPASRLRGAYASDRGWRRRAASEGGLVALFGSIALGAGLRRLLLDEPPAAGDVGLVWAPRALFVAGAAHGRLVLAGGIFAGRRWVLKLERGLVALPQPSLAVWGLR